jgi:hypothetical protein
MCFKTSKLCRCGHRGHPKWDLCINSTPSSLNASPATSIISTSTRSSTLTREPCHDAIFHETEFEHCTGKHDFCCSEVCCEYNVKSTKRQTEEKIAMILRGSQHLSVVERSISEPEIYREWLKAAEEFKQEMTFHRLCAGKRAEYEEKLRMEQPFWFVQDSFDGSDETHRRSGSSGNDAFLEFF